MARKSRIGFISTRFAGTDGVSLETTKWAQAFEAMGHTCFYLAGECDTPAERSITVPEAHFEHEDIRSISAACFGTVTRRPGTTRKIHSIQGYLKRHIYSFIDAFAIDIIVIENALSIPMNIPLALALTELIAETSIPTIAHHHDFTWERKRFLINAISDYLTMAYPPRLPSIEHVVINSAAAMQLSFRTGISSTIIPNVMDFDNPVVPDEYASDMRSALGIAPGTYFLLQPTRVVKRKGIEHAIELAHSLNKLGLATRLVVTHASGDEGYQYQARLQEYSSIMKVDTCFVSDIIKPKRGITRAGQKIYTPADAYQCADLVTYPSSIEGFGNAFLEAIYYRRPIVVNNYAIYDLDIKPKGFHCIELNDSVDGNAVALATRVLKDSSLCQEITEHNYRLGQKYFSYTVLERELHTLVCAALGW